MIDIRWRKALRDLWLNKSRTFLVTLSITIGVLGVGIVTNAYAILTREMQKNYMNTQPASATLFMEGAVNNAMLQQVRDHPEIIEVDTRQTIEGRILVGPNEWKNIQLFIVPDFNDLNLDTFFPYEGSYPPAEREIIIERAAQNLTRAQIGQTVSVNIPNQSAQQLKFSGTVHAPGLAPAWMEGYAYGYITPETLVDLGGNPAMNQVKILVSPKNQQDKSRISEIAYLIKDQLEQSGYRVTRIEIPDPGRHPHASQMDTLLFLLEAFGLIALGLSGVLVANMISAMLAQQVRQIGIMKAIGATTGQISQIYFASVAILGIAGSLAALPMALFVGRAYSGFAAQMLNFQIFDNSVDWQYFVIQIGVGLILPLLVAAYPILRGSRISVREALCDFGVSGQIWKGTLESWLGVLNSLPRPLMFSLRNTFRKQERLILTLATLAIGGAGFIVATNVSASMNTTVIQKFAAFQYDIQVRFSKPYPQEKMIDLLGTLPGVSQVEGWGSADAVFVYADHTTSNSFALIAPPSTTRLMTALPVISGRWLEPLDQNALVINQALLAKNPSLKVGEQLTLRIGGKESKWKLVGVVQEIMSPAYAYANGQYLSSLTDQSGEIRIAVIQTTDRAVENVASIAKNVESNLSGANISVGSLYRLADIRQAIEDHLKILSIFLVMMSILVLIVGGLGLASTMSINILERRRELGIMRAIGASTPDILRIVIGEAGVIGALSWMLAVLVSWPVSTWISFNFGMTFFEAPLQFAVSPGGIVLWFVIAIVFAGLASFYPAWEAACEPVHEVLAYE